MQTTKCCSLQNTIQVVQLTFDVREKVYETIRQVHSSYTATSIF